MAIRTFQKSEHEYIITLDQTFDFSSVEDFRKAYEKFNPVNNSKMVIDFRNTRYIDSSALGMLINLQKHVDAMSCKIRLINSNPDIKKIFSISRFDKKFDID